MSLIGLSLVGETFSQDGQNTRPSANEIVEKAAAKSEVYRDDFRNFLADETKIFSRFGDSGTEQTRTVESTFLVYRLPGEANISAEMRNVRIVDGRPIPDAQRRNDIFLAEIEKTKVSERALRKLQSASEKYDRTVLIFGMTLHQAVILEPHIRPVFEFVLAGTEKIDGRDALVVNYRQKSSSPFIRLNQKDIPPNGQTVMNFEATLPKELLKTGFEIRGRLHIDAMTFAVLGETRELVLRPSEPIEVMRSEFAYRPDQNGVMLPREISLIAFKPVKIKGRWNSVGHYRVDFTYTNFRRTEVDVRIVDDAT